MEQKPSTARIALKWGFLTAIALVIYSTILFVTDSWKDGLVSSMQLLIWISGLVFALKEYKEANEGFLRVRSGLSLGVQKGAVIGIIVAAYKYIYYGFVDTTMPQQELDFTRQKYEEFGMDEQMIEEAIEKAKWWAQPNIQFLMNILVCIVIAFFLSLIISAIMRKKKSEI